ncbi:MAG: hypothetical protein Q9202_005547 [Teloschistes flavicans]
MSSASPSLLERLRTRLTSLYDLSTYNGYEAALLRTHLSFTSASLTPTPTLTCTLTVAPSLCNPAHNMQGGATATIFDIVTTMAVWLVAEEGFWMVPGVSRDLHVVYLDAVKEGQEVEISAEVVKIGRRLCQLRGVMRRRSDGVVVATCEHGKVSLDRGSGGAGGAKL